MNPLIVNDLEDAPPPVEKIDYKSRDLALYRNWKQTGSKRDMSQLVKQLGPILYREVAHVSGTLPSAALNAEVKNWAIKAVHSFDEDKGFALSTHVTNYIRRVRRLNYKYQNAARLPEHMQREFHVYNLAHTQLSDELNEEPSVEHMADRLGWSKSRVAKFKSRIYSDHFEGGEEAPTEVSQYSDEGLLAKSLLSNLNAEEKTILQFKGKISAGELAAKLSIDTNSLNYKQRKLTEKLKMLKQSLDM